MNKIIVVGASVVDVLVKSKELKVLKSHEVAGGVAMCEVMGGKIEAEELEVCSGGGGSNVAVGLKKIGESVKLISRIGEDGMGKIIESELTGYQLDLAMLQKGKGKTGVSTVLVNSSGGRSIVTFRGESLKIENREIDWEVVKKADWIQISSLGGRMDLLTEFVNFGHSNGIKVGVNPGKAELESAVFKEILPKVDFLSLNRAEASKLTGLDFEKEEDVLKKINDFGVRVVTVTDGRRGATLMRANKWYKMETFANKSVDYTGHVHAFVCGALSGILDYKNDEDILKMGLANGSSVVSQMGAKAGLLTKGEMEKWMKKKLKTVEGWI